MGKLGLDFYRRDVLEVARDLLGRILCRRVGPRTTLRGTIVEVEAYDGPGDRASHAHRGRTPRNRPMFDAGGIAYVYLVYGVHHCFNVVTGEVDYPAAILVRAADIEDSRVNASGPGRLTRAFRIDRTLDGASLLGRDLWLEEGSPPPRRSVLRTPRIGVAYAGPWADKKFRFVIEAHPAASGPRRLNQR